MQAKQVYPGSKHVSVLQALSCCMLSPSIRGSDLVAGTSLHFLSLSNGPYSGKEVLLLPNWPARLTEKGVAHNRTQLHLCFRLALPAQRHPV